MSETGCQSANFHEGTRSEYLAHYVFSTIGTCVPVSHPEEKRYRSALHVHRKNRSADLAAGLLLCPSQEHGTAVEIQLEEIRCAVPHSAIADVSLHRNEEGSPPARL